MSGFCAGITAVTYKEVNKFSTSVVEKIYCTSLLTVGFTHPFWPLFRGSTAHKELRGQPLYSGRNGWSQCVLYSEVLLYIRKRTTSL